MKNKVPDFSGSFDLQDEELILSFNLPTKDTPMPSRIPRSDAVILPKNPIYRPLMLAMYFAFVGVSLNPVLSPAHAQQTAAASKSYSIPAGSLPTVLSRFISESGIYLSGNSQLAQGKISPGLQGIFTTQAALAALLVGTGLEGVSTNNNEYVIRKLQTANTDSVLPAVTVTSLFNENATGPVQGYVATRSSTATKTDTRLIENPQSVSVITADEIIDRKVETLDQALRYTAGVTPNMKPWAVDEFSMLRGFELGTAGIFMDGLLTTGRAYSAPIEPYGLERLEVLRGPASVLYGQSPPGGMINAVSKRPSSQAIREIGVEYGSYDRKQLKADIGGALDNTGEWTYRVTMLARNSGTRLDFDKDDRLYLAPTLTWRPNADTKLTLMGQYQKDDQSYAWPNQLQNPGALGQPDPSVNLGGKDNRWERENRMLGYEFEHRFNETWTLQQNLRYSEFDRDETNVFPRSLQADGRNVVRLFYPRSSAWKGLQVDTRLQSKFKTGDISHNALVGVDYSKSRTTDRFPNQITAMSNLDLFNPVYGNHQAIDPSATPRTELYPSEKTGLYVQDQLKLGRWVVTGGLRNDHSKTSNTTVLPAAGTRTLSYEQTARKTTGRLGAVYLFESGWAPYVSYSTSFSPEIGRDVTGQLLKPSTGRQMEAGVRYQPENAKLVYTASVFNLVRKNVTTASEQDPDEVVQTGEVRSRGLELEAKADITRNLSIVAQYTYLDSEIKQSNFGDRGLPQSGAVKHSASVWSKYGFNISDSVRAFSALGVRYYSSARSYQDYSNDNITNPSYTLLDAAFGFDQGPWRFSFNISNLLDKQLLMDCDGTFCYRNAERTFNVSSSYRF